MRSLGNIVVRAWYGRPVKTGKYPAVLTVQGYSTFAMPNWGYQEDDIISLVLNIRGHGNSRDVVNPGYSYPGVLEYFLNDKELYFYRGAYMDCTRAVDFLFSRQEVDTARVAVEGGSQGGALSFATAALNNTRIHYCMPNVPFLSDFKEYFKVASWPGGEMTRYASEHPNFGMYKIYETLSYFDIRNLAGWIRCPLFMACGLKDDVCPPRINFAAYNQVTTPKEYVVYPESGHGLCPEYGILKREKMRANLGLTK
jgi:cephalosporin-C deacetylase-like acetyl esterase